MPITPCRLVDTRSNGGPVQGGTYRTFDLPSLAQANGCADLSAAAVYSLNVTLVPQNHMPVSYLTIWPAGLAQPITSTMNSSDGRVKANAAMVPAGVSASVNVYVTNTTNVILDINGYFTSPSQSTLKFIRSRRAAWRIREAQIILQGWVRRICPAERIATSRC